MTKTNVNASESNDVVTKAITNLTNSNLPTAIIEENIKTLSNNLDNVQKQGYGYLSPFLTEYTKDPNKYSLNHPGGLSAAIVDSLTTGKDEVAAKEKLHEVIASIASGEMKSLFSGSPRLGFTVINTINIMTDSSGKADTGHKQRAIEGAHRASGFSMERIDDMAKNYPVIIGVLSKSDTLKALSQDMKCIIENGSHGSKQNHAAEYLKIEQYEKEVKQTLARLYKNSELDSAAAKQFFKEKSIEGLELYKANYENGMTLKQDPKQVQNKIADLTSKIENIKNSGDDFARIKTAVVASDKVTSAIGITPSQQVKEEPASLWQKFKEFVSTNLQKITDIFKSTDRVASNPESLQASAKVNTVVKLNKEEKGKELAVENTKNPSITAESLAKDLKNDKELKSQHIKHTGYTSKVVSQNAHASNKSENPKIRSL